MVVVSSDFRRHPVGRFWLPIARQLRSTFRPSVWQDILVMMILSVRN